MSAVQRSLRLIGRLPWLAAAGLACVTLSPAAAAVPVSDAAQLNRKAETSGVTVKLVPVTKKRKEANNGVNCAVTTGKKADVRDPTVKAEPGAGARKIQPYAPTMPITPPPAATGGEFAGQRHFQSTGDIVGGLDASRETLVAAQTQFRSASSQIGSAPTVMAAVDMNSAVRIQNGFTWNGAIQSTNLWVAALNALNLVKTSDMSRAASGMQTGAPVQPRPTGSICPAGTIGSGTPADPCRPAPTCSTTPTGTAPDPNCVSARYVDTDGNVLIYLVRIQDQNRAASLASGFASPPAALRPSLTTTDVTAALAAMTASLR